LGVRQGDKFTIEATGSDADEAIKTIEKTMKDNNLI
ncbi:MAG: HPr family phosphocarrier protein, partial [Mycoplasmataceae bacterium]|nr:HPr family phosphocarrier protein [Mycoplasmataceae bacterium]